MRNENIAIYIFLKDITLDGGAERVTFNLANEFIKRYEHVSLISRFRTNRAFHYKLDERVKVYYIEPVGIPYTDAPDASALRKLWYIFRYVWRITAPIDKIVKTHTPEGYTPIVLLSGYETPLYKRKGVKFIGIDHSCAFVWHSKKLLGRWYMAVRRWMQYTLDAACVLSDKQLEDWALLKKPLYIFPNFVADIPDSVDKQCDRSKIIIAAGTICHRKGFDRLIESYSRIACQYPEWKLKIYGNGPQTGDYKELIRKRRMEPYIEILPFSGDIYSVFKSASIFVMTSRREGFGMVTAEAMACGAVPVGLEAEKPSGTGFILRDLPECLAKENDMEDFIGKLERMMQDAELRQRTTDKARKVVKDRFSPEILVEKWSRLFDELTTT